MLIVPDHEPGVVSAAPAAAPLPTRAQLREERQRSARHRAVGRPGYRYDLDGLRAVAIMLVAVYHVFFGRVSGGVDVFLMLSGFFVGGGLLRGFAAGRPVRLATYVPKLVRRLVPTLVVVLAAAGAATVWLLPQTRWQQVGDELVASITYRQNWFLALNGQEYGAADAAQSPLQHIWSMSVQGQIFVGLPVLLLLVWWLTSWAPQRVRFALVVVTVVALLVASFAYAVRSVEVDQPFAYYDTGARVWEYLAGTLLALVVARVRLPAGLASLTGLVGLATILATGMVVDGGATFPGPTTIVPVAGAALLVVSQPGAVNRALASKPLAKAGRYAYAYYLWHWPVLIFVPVALGVVPGIATGVGILVLSGILAIITHHAIENPLRGPGRAPALRSFLVWLLCAAVVVAPLAWDKHLERLRSAPVASATPVVPAPADQPAPDDADGPEAPPLSALDSMVATNPGALAVADPDRFAYDPDVPLIPDLLAVKDDKTLMYKEGCFAGLDDSDARMCEYGDLTSDRVLALVGGSHIQQWADAFDVLGQQHGFRVRVYIKHACELFANTDGIPGSMWADSCITWNENVLAALLDGDDGAPDAVLTTSTRGTGSGGGEERVPGGFVEVFERLDSAGIQVIALRDLPNLPVEPVDELADPNGQHSMKRSSLYKDVSPTEALEGRFEHVAFVDLTDILCPDGVCPFTQGGRVVYLDTHHLTPTYAMSAGPILWQRMQPVLGW